MIRPKSIISLLFLVLLSISVSHATIQVLPPITELKIQRGYSETFDLNFINLGNVDMPVRVDFHPLALDSLGHAYVDSSYDRGCQDWLEILDPGYEFIIKARENQMVTVKVSIPRDAEGGYYAGINAVMTDVSVPLETEIEGVSDVSGFRLQSEVMVIFMVTVPSRQSKPELVQDTLVIYPKGGRINPRSGELAQHGPTGGWQAEMNVENTGIIHTQVIGSLSIWSEAGSQISYSPLVSGKGYIFPGGKRTFYGEGGSQLADGFYVCKLSVQTAEGYTTRNILPFAVYESNFFPGYANEEITDLIRSTSPGFSLKQPLITKKITSGGRSFVVIQLMNLVKDTLYIEPRILEWDVDNTGFPVLGTETSIQDRSCASWLELPEEKFMLAPGKKKNYKLKVTPPEDIAGEYFAAVVFDPEGLPKDLPIGTMLNRTQLISLHTPDGVEYDVKLDTVQITKYVENDTVKHKFKIKIINDSNAHIIATGKMSIEHEVAAGVYKPAGGTLSFGKEIFNILPGHFREYDMYAANLPAGKLRLTVVANYEKDVKPVVHFQLFENN